MTSHYELAIPDRWWKSADFIPRKFRCISEVIKYGDWLLSSNLTVIIVLVDEEPKKRGDGK